MANLADPLGSIARHMDRREFLGMSGAALALAVIPIGSSVSLLSFAQAADGQRFAEGFVFHDLSGNGIKEPGDKGIAGVCVSNGTEVTKTDSKGYWKLPVTEDSIIFVIKPSGWRVPLEPLTNLPRFYYIHKPNGSPDFKFKGVNPTGDLPKSIDFPLQPQREERKFRMVLFGDPQPRNQTEINYMAHDVMEQVVRDVETLNCKFGLSLGDEMFDALNFYESQNRTIATAKIPWYNTVGNHDLNYDAQDNSTATETFQRVFGPTDYAFNYGPVHFIVINDVEWQGKAKATYKGVFSEKSLAFIKNDLAHVDKEKLVVIAFHIPFDDVKNKEELFRLLEGRPHSFSLSAHTHVQENIFLGEKEGWKGVKEHHHLNHATVCGSWWGGATDERGIPHATMSDGCPNGYSIIEFVGNTYKVTFRAASRPEWEQMNLWLPEQMTSVETGRTEIVANIWAGSSRSKVEMKVDGGDWKAMENFIGKDPAYAALKEMEKAEKAPNGRPLPGASNTPHLWKAFLPRGLAEGHHSVEVRTTDMYGQTYSEKRIFRVEG